MFSASASSRREEFVTGEKVVEAKRQTAPKDTGDDVSRERAKARWFWGQRRPIAGTIAEIYLRTARGYRGVIPPTLAFLPGAGHEPALIAAFGVATEPECGKLAIADVDVMAVQLVKLKPDGIGKADVEHQKIIVGKGALGSPIVLAPPNDLLGLAIAEGIEDALSIHAATGLGAWASGGAGRARRSRRRCPTTCTSCGSSPIAMRRGSKGRAGCLTASTGAGLNTRLERWG